MVIEKLEHVESLVTKTTMQCSGSHSILEKNMSINITEQFLQKYFDALMLHKCQKGNYWKSIVNSIRSKNSINQKEYEELEIILNRELDKLGKNQLLAIYNETENGASLDDPTDENCSLHLIKIELVEELMDQITSIAWEQASNNQ